VQARATFVPVTAQLAPRASLWALATPLVVLGAALGLLDLGPDGAALEAAASRLEHIAESCRPDHETFVNPAKSLALELAGTLPVAWGAGAGGAVAATRLAAQLAENAKTPAVAGALPEAHHNQVVALDGDLAGGSADADLFRDRVAEEEPLRVRLVLLHDDDGSPEPAALVAASQRLADDRGVRVSTVVAQGAWPLERFAGLVGVVDFASVYLALARGVDPTPVAAIDELKAHRA
jgi:glucose/mannose-6-phosphate isomerase